jgi:multidrug efflux pump subunit AcrA (membrane-fusion protein)
MSAKQFTIFALAIATLAVAAGEGLCQGPARYYPPAGPTLPSQLNYFRRDVGLLDQYNSFVFPRQQLDYQFAQMAAQQQADLLTTQRQLEQIKQIRASEAAATGTASGFMNYSHYYRLPSGGAARPRTR